MEEPVGGGRVRRGWGGGACGGEGELGEGVGKLGRVG